MTSSKAIELLAPAKNLNTGIEAIRHGADAVYIGADRFGARAAAGNSIGEIEQLVRFAHLFGTKVYVTVNTLFTDEELPQVQQLIGELYRIHVDAVLVQDMALLRLPLPPIPLHASTQMDLRTPEKVKFVEQAGFSQAVLARELSLKQIAEIREQTGIPLEVFVHGALCVSYSGQCYASQHCFGRSANRGECAQFCRLPFTLEDAGGNTILREKHLLSLKDMNRSDYLEKLLQAGVTSFKIEGRLKEESYVKNITAYYRQQLDAIFKRQPQYRRASSGCCSYTFTPAPEKSFNRGFTDYFMDGRRKPDIYSIDTPKAIGEPVGEVKEITTHWLTVAGTASFANGDGLCFFDEKGHLQGFRVNRAEGNKLFPYQMPTGITKRTPLYRNQSQAFEQTLAKPSAERKIAIDIEFAGTPFGYAVTLTDEDGNHITTTLATTKQTAQTPQQENIRATLTKLGDTPFMCQSYTSQVTDFIPSSQLTTLRRTAIELLTKARYINYKQEYRRQQERDTATYPQQQLTYLGNVLNREAAMFYKEHGVTRCDFAFEKKRPDGSVPIMFCRHCLRYSLGGCPKEGAPRLPYTEPYTLVSTDGKRFRIEFDCKQCIMKIYS